MKKRSFNVLMALITVILISCQDEPPEENRVDTVNKLINKNQIRNYIMKYEDELDIGGYTENIDKLIDEDNEDYKIEKGNPTSRDINVDYEFKKKGNQHYIEVDIIYEVTFTEHYKEFIYTRVRHREVKYDIGKVFILLNVDYNEDGYLLKGRKLVTDEKDI